MFKNLAEIGALLNPSLKEELDQSKQAKGFKDWLEKNDNWLLIYDNVDDPEELFPFVPLNKKGDCLFTSNSPQIKNLGEDVNIEKLKKFDAEKLLFNRSNNASRKDIEFADEKEKESFDKITEEIDGLPLSLNTTGAFISKNQISFEEFYRKLNRIPNILIENEDGFDNYQNKSALKAFSIALNDISDKKVDDEFESSAELAQKLLRVVSYIAPDNIPETLLQKTLQNITKIDFESEANEDLWLEIRRKSLSYDLLKYDRSLKFFYTHQLLQKVIQTKLSKEEQKEILQKTSTSIDNLFEYFNHKTKENCELYIPHSVTLIKFIEKVGLISEETASIYAKIGLYFRDTSKYKTAKIYFEKSIKLFRQLFGAEHKNIVNGLIN